MSTMPLVQRLLAAAALLLAMCGQVLAHSGAPDFSGTFDGTTASTDSSLAHTGSDGSTTELVNTFSLPSGSPSWAGFSNKNANLYPLQFSLGSGVITFDAKAPSGDVELKFRFEANPYPDTSPNFETAGVTVSGSSLQRYSVTFSVNPAGQTYNSFLMYLITKDTEVQITNIAVCQDTSAANQCDSSNFVLPVQPTKYDVTFKVDMTGVDLGANKPTLQGTFNNWCGDCGNRMTKVGSTDVWELKLQLVDGDYEYKYAIGNWQAQESVPSTCSDTLGSGPYNRYVNVNGAAVGIPVRPYGGCVSDSAGGESGTDSAGGLFAGVAAYNGHTVTICKSAYLTGHSIDFYVSDLALTESLSVLALQDNGVALAGYGNISPKEDLCNTGFVGTFDSANGFALSSSAIKVRLEIVGKTDSQHTVSITPEQLPSCAITFPCDNPSSQPAPTTYSNTDIDSINPDIKLTVCKNLNTLEYRFDDSASSVKLDKAFAGQKEPGYTSQVIYESAEQVELKGDAPWTVKVTFGSSSTSAPSTLTSSQILWSTEGFDGNYMIQAKLRQPIQVPDCVVRIGCLNDDYVEYDFPAEDIRCSHLRIPDSDNVEVWKFDSDFQLDATPCPDAEADGGQCNSEKQAYDLSASDIDVASPKSTLTITTRKDSNINTHDDAGWVSSRFHTKGTSKTIRVGDRLCADAKLPSALGYWPALWFMGEGDEMTRVGADPWAWPQIGEIDMVEITTSNGPAYDHSHFHYRTKGAKADFPIGGSNSPDEYTRWCIALYEENVVVTRQALDGIGGATTGALTVRSNPWPDNPDMQYKRMDWFFIVNVAIGGTLGGDISDLQPFAAEIGNVKKYTSAKSHAYLQDECVVTGRCAEFSYTSYDKMSTWLMEAHSNLDITPFMIPYGPWAFISAEDATTNKRSLIFSPLSAANPNREASGFVNAADNIYPLRFPNGGTIIFTYDLVDFDFHQPDDTGLSTSKLPDINKYSITVAEICKMQIVLTHHKFDAYGNGANDKVPAISITGDLSFGYSTFTVPASPTYYNSLTFNFVDTAAGALEAPPGHRCELKDLKVRINVNPPNDPHMTALMSDFDVPYTGCDTGGDTGGDLSSVGSQELLEELNSRRCQGSSQPSSP